MYARGPKIDVHSKRVERRYEFLSHFNVPERHLTDEYFYHRNALPKQCDVI